MQYLPEKLYLAEQVREMDRLAIEESGLTGVDLMQKAGQAVFELIQQYYSGYDITIFCGAGNNAGDGYVIAKLALQAKIRVNLIYVSKPDDLPFDAFVAYEDFINQDGLVTEFNNAINLKRSVIIDALLGTGLGREVSGNYAEAIRLINDSNFPVIAVDIPSGLNANTGNAMGLAVKANYTVSFIALKQGMYSGNAAEYCGKIVFSSLDLPDSLFKSFDCVSRRITDFCLPRRNRCAHKGDYGHVLVVGGYVGFSGAIRLAAEAALRVGAGLVTIATHHKHVHYMNSSRPELMCHGVDNADELLPLLSKATVVVIGPGLGENEWGRRLFRCVAKAKKPMIVDADALNILSNEKKIYDNWVLTPHPGEAARLLACSTSDIAKDRFSAVSALQKKYGGIAVLKGAGTLVCDGYETAVCTTGNPGMASGGMGDVLAGIVGGLAAQEKSMFKAATLAVHLHGKAADLSAKQQGEIGMLASDLMPFIRKLVNESSD
jgi:NAD(P)H-hydrate epimerase